MNIDGAVWGQGVWMPTSLFYEDKRWLSDQMRKIPKAQQMQAAIDYSRLYNKAMKGAKHEFEKVGKARFAANSWLTHAIESGPFSRTEGRAAGTEK